MRNIFTLNRPLGRSRPARWARALALLGGGLLLGSNAQAQTQTFNYTGGNQSYTVPAGVTTLQVVATGASGGVTSPNANYSVGAQVRGTVVVVPGEVLTVVVGGQGASSTTTNTSFASGGFNRGGSGARGGAAGGGATDLRRTGTSTGDYLTSRNALLVAGGGGGSANLERGGNGGSPTGGNGTQGGNARIGEGATQSGTGAGDSYGFENAGAGGGAGIGSGGGGGGGGYYGAGSGGARMSVNTYASGGGGSSWVMPNGSSAISYGLASTASNGTLSITALISPPTATNGSTCATGAVTLTASGAPSGGSYRWYTQPTGGTPISGATGASYTTPLLYASTTYYVSIVSGTETNRTPVQATIYNTLPIRIIAGGPTTFTAPGQSVSLTAQQKNLALRFDGSTQYVSTDLVPSPTNLPSTTWEAWVYPTRQDGSEQTVLSADRGGYSRGIVMLNNNFVVGTGGSSYPIAAPVTFSTWQHVAVVYTASSVTFYKDGVQTYTSTLSGSGNYVTFNIGRNPSFGNYFQGQLDEVRVWNTARTAAQVQANRSLGLPGTTAGLVGYWRFNEGGGTVAHDETNTYDGTLTGSPTYQSTDQVYNNVGTIYAWTPTTGLSASITQTVTASPAATTTYTVTVTDLNGCVGPASQTVTIPVAAPTLTSLSPTSGPVGTSVTITGSNLTGATKVTFGVTAATFTVNATGTSITATVPSNFAGSVAVQVTTPGGTSNTPIFLVTAAPTVSTTLPATNVTTTSATLGGNVTDDGRASVTDRGVVYVAGTGTPAVGGTGVTQTSATPATGTGSFTVNATGLTPGTQYTVRAYATNSVGTSYGSSVSFTTSQAATAAPVLNTPANNSITNNRTVTVSGTAPANSTVSIYVFSTFIGTTTATASGTFSFVIGGSANDGTYAVSATAQSAGAAVSGFSNANAFTVDGTAPTASLSSPAGASGGSTATSPVPFTVTFSEPVTNFSTSGVMASGGAVTGFNGSGTTYNVLVTASGPGAVSLSVVANQAQDAAGNGNTATGPYTLTFTPAAPQNLTISTGTATSPVAIAAGTYGTITVTSTGYAQLAGAVQVNTSFAVSGGLNTNCQPLTGAGSFTLNAGGTLGICDAAGITASGATGAVQVSGLRTFDTDASYLYNGTGTQNTGAGLPGQVRNLSVVNNLGNVLLSTPTSVAQVLAVAGDRNLVLNAQQALTLLSDATGTALVVNGAGGAVLGSTATMQRYLDPNLNPGQGYRHLASPVRGNTLADLTTPSYAPVFNPAYNTSPTPGTVTPFPTMFGYDQSRVGTVGSNYAPFDQGFFSPTAATAFVPGTGYTVNLPGTEKVAFTGFLNRGDVVRNLARSTDAAAGWHLVGNPYPSPLDYSLVAASDRTGLDAAMYVYESTGQYVGNYRTYNNGIGNALIGSSQGFFVRVSQGQTAGRLTFRNAQRVTDYTTQVAVRRGTADARPQLTLALAGNGLADALTVYAEAGATTGFDAQYDAEKLANPSGLNLASLTAAGQQLAIDGRAGFATATALPLFVGVPAAGSYTLTTASLANLAGTRAELVDNLTGTRTLLTTGTSYAFSMSTTTAPGRFWLNLSPATAPLATSAAALAAQVLAYPNPAHDRLTVVRPAGAAASAVLLNALGQVVRTIALPTAETTVDVSGLATGIYTLRLTLPGQTVARRVVLN